MRGSCCPRAFRQRIHGQVHVQHCLATCVNTTQYTGSCSSHSHEIPWSSSDFVEKEGTKTLGRDGIENGERINEEGLSAIVKEPRYGEQVVVREAPKPQCL